MAYTYGSTTRNILNCSGMGLFSGSRNAAVTMSKLSKMAASITLVYWFSKGFVKRWTIRTVRATRLMKNCGREGVREGTEGAREGTGGKRGNRGGERGNRGGKRGNRGGK